MTHDDAPAIFDAHAQIYDASRRRLIPPFDRFYDTAVEAVSLCATPPRRILDLGAGTGLLSARIADAHPGAELHLLDAAPAMLEQAMTTLGDGATPHVGDLNDPLPAGPFGAVVSSLAIHHLDDAAKRELFARVHAALEPGGVFVNADQVAGPTPLFAQWYATWHEQTSVALGATRQEWDESLERRAFDRCATLRDQLTWLSDAGFADVDCLFSDHLFAVLVARRAFRSA
jgi:tRNA (cmo5U34)-methyltransferase